MNCITIPTIWVFITTRSHRDTLYLTKWSGNTSLQHEIQTSTTKVVDTVYDHYTLSLSNKHTWSTMTSQGTTVFISFFLPSILHHQWSFHSLILRSDWHQNEIVQWEWMESDVKTECQWNAKKEGQWWKCCFHPVMMAAYNRPCSK